MYEHGFIAFSNIYKIFFINIATTLSRKNKKGVARTKRKKLR